MATDRPRVHAALARMIYSPRPRWWRQPIGFALLARGSAPTRGVLLLTRGCAAAAASRALALCRRRWCLDAAPFWVVRTHGWPQRKRDEYAATVATQSPHRHQFRLLPAAVACGLAATTAYLVRWRWARSRDWLHFLVAQAFFYRR